jgi:hypothetical protein
LKKETNMKVIDLYNMYRNRPAPRSTFDKAVRNYQLEMLESIIDNNFKDVNKDSDVSQVKISHLLNHVEGDFLSIADKATKEQWAKVRSLCHEASYGGNFLVYTEDVMENLYPKSMRTNARRETCLDKQATALAKAISLMHVTVHAVTSRAA